MNTVGPKLEELKEGEEITVFFETPGESGSDKPINAMTISK
jgi:hypothetical protein